MTATGPKAMGRLTTHVLDTARGLPAAGPLIELFRPDPRRERIAEAVSNADGRLDEPLLEGEDLRTGSYELVFHAGTYLSARATGLGDPPSLGLIPIRSFMAEDAHYHVPRLLAPSGYTTYRGS
jgi:5-hydroxyisourate hydrolase